MKNRTTFFNILTTVMLQVVTIVSGLILPRIILSYFGSAVNGMISSICQFLNYITLLEGGVTSVISANLYKPLVKKDWKKVSSVIVTAKRFYNKVAITFIFYTFVIAVIYPRVVDTGFDNLSVLIIVVILSAELLVQYMFSLTLMTLLNADKKVYVVSLATIIVTVFNVVLVIISVKIYPNIFFLKAVSAFSYILKPFFLGIYVRKHYDIAWNEKEDNSLIAQRWNGFAINLAFFIHTCTDITVLTIFSDLNMISVYSIYCLIISRVSSFIHSIASGIEPTIGQAYAQNAKENLGRKIDLYEFVVFFMTSFLLTVTALTITPFVMMYTKGISDADYYQPVFAIIMVVAEFIYLIRYPYVTLAYVANKFKEITIPAYIEAGINIVISIALIKKIGLSGIAIGTLFGMLFRLIFHVKYTEKILPQRKVVFFLKKVVLFIIPMILGSLICIICLPMNNKNMLLWCFYATVYSLIIGGCLTLFSVLFFKDETHMIFKYLKKEKK